MSRFTYDWTPELDFTLWSITLQVAETKTQHGFFIKVAGEMDAFLDAKDDNTLSLVEMARQMEAKANSLRKRHELLNQRRYSKEYEIEKARRVENNEPLPKIFVPPKRKLDPRPKPTASQSSSKKRKLLTTMSRTQPRKYQKTQELPPTKTQPQLTEFFIPESDFLLYLLVQKYSPRLSTSDLWKFVSEHMNLYIKKKGWNIYKTDAYFCKARYDIVASQRKAQKHQAKTGPPKMMGNGQGNQFRAPVAEMTRQANPFNSPLLQHDLAPIDLNQVDWNAFVPATGYQEPQTNLRSMNNGRVNRSSTPAVPLTGSDSLGQAPATFSNTANHGFENKSRNNLPVNQVANTIGNKLTRPLGFANPPQPSIEESLAQDASVLFGNEQEFREAFDSE